MSGHEGIWKKQDNWGIKEFILLLAVEFVIIIGFVKFVMKPLLSQWFQDDLYAGTLIGLIMAVLLTTSIYFIALRPQKLSWREIGIKPFAAKDWKIIVLYSVFVIVGSAVIMVLTSFVGNTVENSKTEAVQQNITFLTVLIAFISAAVISPLYEEFFYRGFIYRWLRTRIGLKGALLISSFIFMIVHIPTYNVMPVNFFSGVLFALAYERTGSIWPSVLIHGLTNGVYVLLTVLG